MPYELTPQQAESITDVEIAFSTERLLPRWEDVPEAFRRGNAYTQLVEKIFYGQPLPDWEMHEKAGFNDTHIRRVVRAHLGSFGPKHEHKIAGVGLMLACMCELQTNAREEPARG